MQKQLTYAELHGPLAGHWVVENEKGMALTSFGTWEPLDRERTALFDSEHACNMVIVGYEQARLEALRNAQEFTDALGSVHPTALV